jgi:hypothetical protein
MTLSYLDAVRQGFPTVMATCNGDPYIYDNLEWTGGDAIPSQDDLDVWISSNFTKTLTKYQFRQLFTLTERVTCDNFALNSAIPANYKAILVTMFKDLEVSAEVHLDNPQTQQGVQMLEQLGLIGHGRAAQILANTPAPTA